MCRGTCTPGTVPNPMQIGRHYCDNNPVTAMGIACTVKVFEKRVGHQAHVGQTTSDCPCLPLSLSLSLVGSHIFQLCVVTFWRQLKFCCYSLPPNVYRQARDLWVSVAFSASALLSFVSKGNVLATRQSLSRCFLGQHHSCESSRPRGRTAREGTDVWFALSDLVTPSSWLIEGVSVRFDLYVPGSGRSRARRVRVERPPAWTNVTEGFVKFYLRDRGHGFIVCEYEGLEGDLSHARVCVPNLLGVWCAPSVVDSSRSVLRSCLFEQ